METSFSVEARDFSLSQTLECGQCFRFEHIEGAYVGVVRDKQLSLRQSGELLYISGCSREDYDAWLCSYLGLSSDYSDVKTILCRDSTLAAAVAYCPGIRIMHQPFWETLCSFIISQNNNIKRISGIIARLCECFGEDCGGYFAFPTAEVLASLSTEDLAPLRCGFRARYIIDGAKKCSDKTVDEDFVKEAPLDEARAMLMKIVGVGKKVADCTLLFGANRLEAFPEDVWIKRAMASLFPLGLPEAAKPYAGIAQQYIFHYVRTSGVLSNENSIEEGDSK
ncbi:MAG: DNA glycosylase [Oscillospiraceae bacterium]